MENESKKPSSKKIKTVWAIIIVLVIAAVAGGMIYFFANGNELQDDIYSISFSSPVQFHKTVIQKATSTTSSKLPKPVKK